MLGVICSIAIQIDLHKGISMIISTIPHHFLELFAMCIVVSSLFKLNQSIVRKITNFFRQDKKQNYSFKTACMNLMKSYLLIALPLYILAAFTETYVSNFIYEILQ
ncbi:stage II sporulation protein M [Staphylococcus hyicus]|uniref:stage II sporulation protein M n=1 Tax=Staphylococcus hyicus TaxID=1284 RepID=UPI0023664167|nr:stage II sporulation protein M [Staphylococcus hyicus]